MAPLTKPAPSTNTLTSIEGIIFDCDGVLTPGDLYYNESGERWLRFNARDGLGLAAFCKKFHMKAGIPETRKRMSFACANL